MENSGDPRNNSKKMFFDHYTIIAHLLLITKPYTITFSSFCSPFPQARFLERVECALAKHQKTGVTFETKMIILCGKWNHPKQ